MYTVSYVQGMYNNVQSKIIYNEYTIKFKECKVVYRI